MIKRILYCLFLLVLPLGLYAQDDDAMKLVYDLSDINLLVTLPLFADTVNITIDWGDDSVQTAASAAFMGHIYEAPGEYTVTITGELSHLGYTHPTGSFFRELKEIESWGNLGLTSLENAFIGARALRSVPDSIPSSVTNTSYMFSGAENFDYDLSNWNVSNIKQMEAMFANAKGFDQDLGSWDVSNVTNFNNIFLGIYLSTENYSNTLVSWSQLNLQSDLHFVGGYSQYDSTGAAARQKIINDFNWTFDDGGYELELFYFDLLYQNSDVRLSWNTLPGVYQSKFFIERVVDTVECGGLDLNTWYSWEWALVDSVEFNTDSSYIYIDSTFCSSAVAIYYRLKQVSDTDETKYSQLRLVYVQPVTGIDGPGGNEIPTEFSLSQNYPNPFNPTTKIKYSVIESGNVSLKVYDVLGREVMTLVNKIQSPGNYEVEMNGAKLASGVYIYRIQSGDFTMTKKLILLK